jgi:hypothetical protein
MGEQCSDRWRRELRSGLKAYASLWVRDDGWRFEIILKSPGEWMRGEVSEIADEIIEVLDRHEVAGSMFPWERDRYAEQLMEEEGKCP